MSLFTKAAETDRYPTFDLEKSLSPLERYLSEICDFRPVRLSTKIPSHWIARICGTGRLFWLVVGDGIEAVVQSVVTANIDASQQFAVTERAWNRASAVSHWARAEGGQDINDSNTFYPRCA